MTDKVLRLTPEAFFALPEYSRTLPTRATPGKRWRCLYRGRWRVGEYGEIREGARTIAILWYKPVLQIRADTSPPIPWPKLELMLRIIERENERRDQAAI